MLLERNHFSNKHLLVSMKRVARLAATIPTTNSSKKVKCVLEDLFLIQPRKQVPAGSRGRGKSQSSGYRGFLPPFVTGFMCDI